VTWNSEAGHVSGKIIKVHTKDVDYKGHTHHPTEDDPQYEIKGSETRDRSHRDAQRFSTKKAARLTALRRTTCIGTSLAPRVALRSGVWGFRRAASADGS